LRAEITPGGQKNKSKASDANNDAPHFSASTNISWTRLLKRMFDIEQCRHCGGTQKIIATILESSAITKILYHFGPPVRAPPRAPAQIHYLLRQLNQKSAPTSRPSLDTRDLNRPHRPACYAR